MACNCCFHHAKIPTFFDVGGLERVMYTMLAAFSVSATANAFVTVYVKFFGLYRERQLYA